MFIELLGLLVDCVNQNCTCAYDVRRSGDPRKRIFESAFPSPVPFSFLSTASLASKITGTGYLARPLEIRLGASSTDTLPEESNLSDHQTVAANNVGAG